MKKLSILLALTLVVALTMPAVAELEEITAGGSIQIRGQMMTPGVDAHEGLYGFDEDIEALDWFTQRTRVNVDAKMSGGVRGFVELQSYDFWGVDSDGTEGIGLADDITDDSEVDDGSDEAWDLFGDYQFDNEWWAGQGDDYVQLHQAYIEMNDIADYPIRLRIGRQEMTYGREWLVGNNDAGVNFSGLSFDAIRLSYDTDLLAVDLWTAKLMDLSSPHTATQVSIGPVQEDADIDFHGLYATYKGVENMDIDGYFLWVRDAASNSNYLNGGDTDSVLNLYTVGGRVAGAVELGDGMLDYNVEAAMQFGDNNNPDASNDSGEFGGWAFNAMAGYTFDDVQWTPRAELEYAYFSGDDEDDEDTDTFVRLFSDVHYGELNLGQNLDAKATNLHIFRAGVSAVPAEKLTVSADLYYFLLAEDDEDGYGETFGMEQQTSNFDDEAGLELDLAADYQYTEDLNLRAGWAHFFAGDAIENSWGDGDHDDDVDYLYVQALLTF